MFWIGSMVDMNDKSSGDVSITRLYKCPEVLERLRILECRSFVWCCDLLTCTGYRISRNVFSLSSEPEVWNHCPVSWHQGMAGALPPEALGCPLLSCSSLLPLYPAFIGGSSKGSITESLSLLWDPAPALCCVVSSSSLMLVHARALRAHLEDHSLITSAETLSHEGHIHKF